MKTAVIYARYSSERQTEQSIEGQLSVCNDYAQRNNILIVDTYIDRAMTGTNDNRTQFQKMLKDSAKTAWDVVLVYKLDRFSRDKYEMAIHRKTLHNNGVKLVSILENGYKVFLAKQVKNSLLSDNSKFNNAEYIEIWKKIFDSIIAL